MNPISRFLTAVLCVPLLLSVSGHVNAEQLALPTGDLIAPEVSHQPNLMPIKVGEPYVIKAKVKDNVGVKSVILFYRTKGQTAYSRVEMLKNEGDNYSVELEPQVINSPGLEYYIQAEDYAGNTLLHGYSFSPISVAVNGSSPAPTGADNKGMTGSSGETLFSSKTKKWIWIGAGIAAAVILASSGKSDDSQPPAASKTTTINFTGPALP